MKILYAIQGTGNGHITVAREVLPFLKAWGEVDLLISGTQVDIDIDHPVKYRMDGLCFVFGKKGGIDYAETFRRANVKQLYHDIKTLPVNDYNLIISDFEPVSTWACALHNKKCVGFSHQAAVVAKQSPKADSNDPIGKAVLKYYAPASHYIGFHFLPYGNNIHTPIIRNEIRQLPVTNKGHYTVYLPAYSDKKLIKLGAAFPNVQWDVFSKHAKQSFTVNNIHIKPINNQQFIESMVSAAGVLCGAGFQTPSEALYLKKKLCVIPMKGQYEQQCNGAALKLLGVPVLKSLKQKHFHKIKAWLESGTIVNLVFTDETQLIIQELVEEYADEVIAPIPMLNLQSTSKFRELLLKKIFQTVKS